MVKIKYFAKKGQLGIYKNMGCRLKSKERVLARPARPECVVASPPSAEHLRANARRRAHVVKTVYLSAAGPAAVYGRIWNSLRVS